MLIRKKKCIAQSTFYSSKYQFQIRFKCYLEPDTDYLLKLKEGIRLDLYDIGIDAGKVDGPSWRTRYWNFYRSAAVKFHIHFTAHLLFLILFGTLICLLDPVKWASGLILQKKYVLKVAISHMSSFVGRRSGANKCPYDSHPSL